VIFVKLMLIPMLIKTLLATRQPLLCAVLYGAALFTNGLIFDAAFGDPWKVAGELVLSTVVAYGYFWTLKELDDTGPPYWAALIVGTGILAWI
jgi:hypothetical protein